MLKNILLAGLLVLVACGPKTSTESTETTTVTGTTKAAPSDPSLVYSEKKVKSFSIQPSEALYFDVEVTEGSVNLAIAALETMSKFSNNDLYLFINSPGGSVFDGNRLISYIESSPKKIHTVCVSLCASMAAHLHQSGTSRLMVDNSVLMFHPASGGAQGQVENMISLLTTIQTMVDRMDAKVTTRSGLDYKEFKAKVAFEYWVLAEDAVRLHLAEGIVNITTGDPTKPFGSSLAETALKRGVKIKLLESEKKVTPPIIVM